MAFDTEFPGLRDDAIALVKAAGKATPMAILRKVDGTPADPAMPWRVTAGSVQEFQFIGVGPFTIEMPSQGNPTTDGDANAIAPGDLVDTAAEGDPDELCGMPVAQSDRLQVTDAQGTRQYAIIGIQDVTPGDKPIIIKMRVKLWPALTPQP